MYRTVSCALVLIFLSGCGLLEQLFGTGPETGSPQLKAFSSERELTDYLSDQIRARNTGFQSLDRVGVFEDGAIDADATSGASGDDSAAPPPAPEAPGEGNASSDASFSGTTIQEAGVDESDVIKTDGEHLYVLVESNGGSVLRVVRLMPPEQMELVREVNVDGYGREIYLHGDKVIALTTTGGGYFFFGDDIAVTPLEGGVAVAGRPVETDSGGATDTPSSGAAEADDVGDQKETPTQQDVDVLIAPGEPGVGEYQYERPKTVVTILDVSTPEEASVLSTTTFDGTTASSRMIDGVLHLVLSNYQDYYYDVLPMLGRPEFNVAGIEAAEILPTFVRQDADGAEVRDNVVTWRELYRPTDPDGFGVVTVVSLDVDADAAFSAVGVVAEPGLVYSSLEALYLTDTDYNFFSNDFRETTDIYKFAYVGRGAEAVGVGTVPGRILNQYSMGEYQGFLRVATTVGPTFSVFGGQSGPFNNVYVLGDNIGTLEVVGRVENIAPRETIQSARFIGERGYVVTFEQIDPLFTLDLSDPAQPRIIGELKVPGFSTFIVPMDNDHLLTVGQYIPEDGPFFAWGLQLSIFDISDFANPALMDSVVLGEFSGAGSEALYNPKAFTYFADRGLVALPLSLYEDRFFLEDSVDTDVTPPPIPVAIGDIGDAAGEQSGGGSDGSAGSAQSTPPSPGDDSVTSDDDGTAASDDPAAAPPEGVAAEDSYVPGGFEGLAVYRVSVTDGFTELGRISTRFENKSIYWSAFTRGLFVNDDVFAVTNHGVRGARVDDVASVPYELLYEVGAAQDDSPNDEAPDGTSTGGL